MMFCSGPMGKDAVKFSLSVSVITSVYRVRCTRLHRDVPRELQSWAPRWLPWQVPKPCQPVPLRNDRSRLLGTATCRIPSKSHWDPAQHRYIARLAWLFPDPSYRPCCWLPRAPCGGRRARDHKRAFFPRQSKYCCLKRRQLVLRKGLCYPCFLLWTSSVWYATTSKLCVIRFLVFFQFYNFILNIEYP